MQTFINSLKQNIKKPAWYKSLLFLVFLLGFLIRLKCFLINPSFWHDECALGWNIKFKSWIGYFGLLRFAQMAPPFFMILTKLIVKIFGFSDLSLRIIPFLAGNISIISFYFLAKNVFKKKWTILTALFLFAINSTLINYSFQFKPYSLDVLITILCILFFIKVDFEKLSLKLDFLYGFVLALIPWFSLVSVFSIAGGWLSLVLRDFKSDWKKKIVLILPVILSGLLYLKIYLFNNYTKTGLTGYWHGYFVNSDILFFFHLFVQNFKYFFYPVKYNLLSLIFLFWGVILFYKEKKRVANICMISFLLLVFASFLKLYPFFERLIIFLIPIFLIFIIKPLDLIKKEDKIKSSVILLTFLVTFFPQLKEMNRIVHVKTFSRGENPRQMMKDLMKNIKEGDIILVPNSSDTEFAYYSIFYDVKNKVIQQRPYIKNNNMGDLRQGDYCWIFSPFGSQADISQWIMKNTNLIKIYTYEKNNDYLIYARIK